MLVIPVRGEGRNAYRAARVSAGPAARVGLRRHDLLISANGGVIAKAQSLQRLMIGDVIGQALTLTVRRSGALVDVIASPEELRGEE